MKLICRPVHQTLFGGITAPPAERGNCYPACLATILGLPLKQVPHFWADHELVADGWEAIRTWLGSIGGYSVVTYSWSDFRDYLSHWRMVVGDSACIFSGRSPRGEFEHAVVGRITETGWELVHDPHPSGAGLVGEPNSIDLLIQLVALPKAA